MGNLEFIQKKVIAGDYFQVSGDIDTLSSFIESVVISNGRTAFMIEAKIIITNHPNAASNNIGTTTNQKDMVSAALKIDGTIKDKTTIGESTAAAVSSSNQFGGGSGSGYGNMGDGRFNVLGFSLVGDGVKKISIENILDNGNAFASFSYYLV